MRVEKCINCGSYCSAVAEVWRNGKRSYAITCQDCSLIWEIDDWPTSPGISCDEKRQETILPPKQLEVHCWRCGDHAKQLKECDGWYCGRCFCWVLSCGNPRCGACVPDDGPPTPRTTSTRMR